MALRHTRVVLALSLVVGLALSGCASSMPRKAAGSADGGFGIAVTDVEDLGCSSDRLTDPDFRVTVLMGGDEVLATGAAMDRDHPLFAEFTTLDRPDGDVTVRIRVEEAEPTGFLGTETAWVHCDSSAGNAQDLEFTWSGDGMAMTGEGDGADSVRVRVVLGDDAPPAPAPALVATGEHSVAVTGSGVLAWPRYGPVLGDIDGDATVDGLCDNMQFSFRLIQRAGDWQVASQAATVTTRNAAPDPPVVWSAKNEASGVHLDWVEPTAHDIDHYEVYGGATQDAALAAGNRLGEASGPAHGGASHSTSTAGQTIVPGVAEWVVVRAVDTGGLTATSAAFHVGSADATRPDGSFDDCNEQGHLA